MATPQELARSELQKRSTYVGQDMKPFESTVNPFNPNFRASVGSAIREFIDDFGFSGGYKQGLENLSDATEFSLDFIPGVGDAVGVGDLRQSISSGDKLGMGIDGAAVALGTIPIAGDVLAKGLKKGESALRNITGPMPEVTRDTPLLQNVGDVDRVNNLVVERTAPQLTEVPIVKAEDLIDRYYTTGITDTSNSDLSTITAVNGIPVSSRQQGGAFFGFQPENIELGHIFASAEKPVDLMLSRGSYAEKQAKALGGRPPVFIPYGMMGPSPDFSTMMTDIMVPYGRQNMSKTNKMALDKRIREGRGDMLGLPSWPGIDKATPQYMQSLGDSRKRVLFGMEEFRDKGSLGISEVRALVTDPNQFDPKFGNINAVYEMDIARGKEPGLHPTYSHSFFGTPLGGFSSPANILDMDLKMGMRKDQKDYLTEMARRQSLQSPEKKHLHNVDIGGKVGSAAQAAIRAGAQGRITRDMVDELIRQGKVIP